MSNVFRQALETIADRRLSEDPGLLSDMWRLRLLVRGGHFDRGLVDAFVQTFDESLDLYDTFGFAMLWSALVKGKIFYAVCELGEECSGDKDIETNSAALSTVKLIRGPEGTTVRCEADFFGGLSDSDGYFRWLDPMRFQRYGGAGPCDTLCVESGELPLEVGTTHAANTYAHIFSELGVARWPYHSKLLYLFYAPLISPGVVSFCRTASDFDHHIRPRSTHPHLASA